MKLKYDSHLKPYSQKLRKSGNLSEVLLRNQLKGDKLGYRFLRQRPIGKYIVDFYCSSLNLAIEIDGASSHNTKILEDEDRQRALELAENRMLRFSDSDVRRNLEGVMMEIRKEILRRHSPTPPLKKEE